MEERGRNRSEEWKRREEEIEGRIEDNKCMNKNEERIAYMKGEMRRMK